MAVKDKATGEIVKRSVRLDHDEGNRPGTTIEDLRSLKPVVEGGIVTAGNASQLSDGASACVVMEAKTAERRGLAPLGRYVGITMAGAKHDEINRKSVGEGQSVDLRVDSGGGRILKKKNKQ